MLLSGAVRCWQPAVGPDDRASIFFGPAHQHALPSSSSPADRLLWAGHQLSKPSAGYVFGQAPLGSVCIYHTYLGSGTPSETFWNDELIPALKRRFVFLDKDTESLATGLRKRILCLNTHTKSCGAEADREAEASVQKLNILKIVLSVTAIYLKGEALQRLSQGKEKRNECTAFAVETPLGIEDIENVHRPLSAPFENHHHAHLFMVPRSVSDGKSWAFLVLQNERGLRATSKKQRITTRHLLSYPFC